MKPGPDNIAVNTYDRETIDETIDDFFIDTMNYVLENFDTHKPGFKIKSGELAYHSEQVTDDRVKYLSYHSLVIATVFATRTDYNQTRYTFIRSLDVLGELTPKR